MDNPKNPAMPAWPASRPLLPLKEVFQSWTKPWTRMPQAAPGPHCLRLFEAMREARREPYRGVLHPLSQPLSGRHSSPNRRQVSDTEGLAPGLVASPEVGPEPSQRIGVGGPWASARALSDVKGVLACAPSRSPRDRDQNHLRVDTPTAAPSPGRAEGQGAPQSGPWGGSRRGGQRSTRSGVRGNLIARATCRRGVGRRRGSTSRGAGRFSRPR
jgi:hypothetical protein